MNISYPVAPVIEELRRGKTPLKLVGASADLTAALTTPPPNFPAAYVLQTTKGHRPEFSGDDGGDYLQKADSAVQVVLWVKNYAGARVGTGARKDMDELLDWLGDRLCGFHPTPDFYPLWFGASTDEHYSSAWLTSQAVFHTEFRIQR